MTRFISRGATGALVLAVGLTLTSWRLSSALAQRSGNDAAPPPPAIPEPLPVPPPAPLALPPSSETPPATPAPLPPQAAQVPPSSSSIPLPQLPPSMPAARTPGVASEPAGPRAVARAEGTAAPGLQVVLHGEESKGVDLRFRWVQTRGPAVLMDQPSSPVARFTVPAGVGPLGFLLVVNGPNGSDTTELNVPIEGLPRAPENTAIHADAGDDQLGLVGRQVTLNGVRSEPRGKIGYRWVQTGGPIVRFKLEDGYVFSFVPTVPGIYRFALVVALGSEISPPDEVTVTVGSGARSAAPAGPAATASVPAEGPVPTQEVARAGLAAIRGGVDSAESLARIFEDAADRMDLYHSYADAYAEMSRRLDDVIPSESTKRGIWLDRLFNPLTARTLEVMRGEGVDLRLPEGQAAMLSAPQKAALAEQFRLMAEGFRSVSRPR
ncbi:MAG: hypothetical protein U0794_22995 [Isosphaeraceae bacterium]